MGLDIDAGACLDKRQKERRKNWGNESLTRT